MPSLRELGEFGLLRRLVAATPVGDGVIVGPGDDASVLLPTPGCELVVTTDSFVDGRHLMTGWGSPADHGARLAVANLSDLAAMAARPRWATLSMGLRPTHAVEAVEAFHAGLTEKLAAHGASLVGGNLVAVEGPEWFDLALIGEVPRGRAWRRAGARPGDLIAITGFPGRAAAGLQLARAAADPADPALEPAFAAWLRPQARVAFALALAEAGGVTAAIDISDGLVADLAHLSTASAATARLHAHAIPVDPVLTRAADVLGVDPLTLQLDPGDDYELILALDPAAEPAAMALARAMATPFARIGRFEAGAAGVWLEDAQGECELAARGYDHFG